jgi:hypothetical protein
MATGPVQPGTTTRGTNQTRVSVQSVDGTIAIVTDQTGRTLQVRRDLMRAKGNPPMAGESWIIDKALGNTWTFAMCLGSSVDGVTVPDTNVQTTTICVVTLTANQSVGANTDTYGASGWTASVDPLSMTTLSSSSGTKSFLTIPTAGRYRLSLTGSMSSVSGAAYAAFVCQNNPVTTTSSVARDNRNAVLTGSEGTRVHADRDVLLHAGDTLYWGFWCSSACTLNATALNVPTELLVRYVGSL